MGMGEGGGSESSYDVVVVVVVRLSIHRGLCTGRVQIKPIYRLRVEDTTQAWP